MSDPRDLALQDAALEIVSLEEDRRAYRELACAALDRVVALTAEVARLKARLVALLNERRPAA